MSKIIIGLTGGIGCGKTTVMKMFKQLNINYVDADIVAREVVAVGTAALNHITNHFGDNYLLPNGELNRTLLRQRIFSNDNDKQWLNELLHPLIRTTMQTQLQQTQSSYALLVAPLLFENNLTKMVDRVLVVDVDVATQISRSVSRDKQSEEVIKNIIASQISRVERLSRADDIIDNQHQSLTDVEKQVIHLHQQYLILSKK